MCYQSAWVVHLVQASLLYPDYYYIDELCALESNVSENLNKNVGAEASVTERRQIFVIYIERQALACKMIEVSTSLDLQKIPWSGNQPTLETKLNSAFASFSYILADYL
jgi:hypothetical protein